MLLRLPADGEGPADELRSPAAAAALPSAVTRDQSSFKQALRTVHYWFLAAMILGISAVFMGINQHLYGHFTLSLGFPADISSRLVGLMMGMTVPGILTAGALTDRIGTRPALMLFGTFLVISLTLLPAVKTVLGGLLFVLAYGFFNVLQTVFPPLLVSGRFGDEHYPAVYGSLVVAQTLGAAFGPFAIGLVFDAAGSYLPAVAAAAAVLAVSVIIGVGVARKSEMIAAR
jgi:MFS family permease